MGVFDMEIHPVNLFLHFVITFSV